MLTLLNFAADLSLAVSLCWLMWNLLELGGELIRWRVMRRRASP